MSNPPADLDVRRALAALAEPTRFQIIALLEAAPRTVGEVAAALGTLQPQTTKHLQTLSAAGLVTVHRLGRRRVASLRRESFRELTQWFDGVAIAHPSERVLDQYRDAIEAEEARLTASDAGDRTIHLDCVLPSPVDRAWRAWTTTDLVRGWWAPEHFEVADCEVHPVVGGALRIVLREGDDTEYTAVGKFLDLKPPHELQFKLSPLGADAAHLFTATQSVSFAEDAGQTVLTMTIGITDIQPAAAPALAGVELGWRQTLDRLAEMLAGDEAKDDGS
jgi:uncharacterized protein YndB with AHSA1/START domain/DNA-binding transcriptional ArsR family regulator